MPRAYIVQTILNAAILKPMQWEAKPKNTQDSSGSIVGRSGSDRECIRPIYVAIYKQHHTDGGRMSGRNEHLLFSYHDTITLINLVQSKVSVMGILGTKQQINIINR